MRGRLSHSHKKSLLILIVPAVHTTLPCTGTAREDTDFPYLLIFLFLGPRGALLVSTAHDLRQPKQSQRCFRKAFAKRSRIGWERQHPPLLFAHPRLSGSRVLAQERPDAAASPDEIEAAPIEDVDACPRLREPRAFQRDLTIAPGKKISTVGFIDFEVRKTPRKPQIGATTGLPACSLAWYFLLAWGDTQADSVYGSPQL